MRRKMTNAERAKQFMPFAAVRGYEEAMEAREFVRVERKILGEDAQAELDAQLRSINRGDTAELIHYANGAYIKTSGTVTALNMNERYIALGEVKIRIDDLLDAQRI